MADPLRWTHGLAPPFQLKPELYAHCWTAQRGLVNEAVVFVIDSQVSITSNERDSWFPLKPNATEHLSRKIRLDAKPTRVKLALEKCARGQSCEPSCADNRISPRLAVLNIH